VLKQKKKALFLLGKFFQEAKSGGQITAILDYDNKSRVHETQLKIVLKGKGLAFKDFKQIQNMQKYTRLKLGLVTAKNKRKNFIFELVGSSKSIQKVMNDCK
jgi:hypothetical protein